MARWPEWAARHSHTSPLISILLKSEAHPGCMAGMRFLFILTALSLTNLSQAEKPNILLICVDDLRPELNCYGVDYIQSPHIDSLAKSGRMFTRHYVQAPTCGASRYTLLSGT